MARIRYEHHDAASAVRTYTPGKLGAIVLERCLYIRRTAVHGVRVARYIVLHVQADNTLERDGSLVTGRRNRELRNYACDENPMFSSSRSLHAALPSPSVVFLPLYHPSFDKIHPPIWLWPRRSTAEWKAIVHYAKGAWASHFTWNTSSFV